MPDYSNGKIYRIICNNTGNMYIGSTCCTLSQRLAQHKSEYNMFLNGKRKHCSTSFDIIKGGNYQIILIEYAPCNNKEELLRKERYFIENMNCVNKVVPLRTDKEYKEDNKDKIKEYNERNKDHIAEVKKQYYINNIEKRRLSMKEYAEKHKDEISRYNKTYRETNKAKLKEKSKTYRENNKEVLLKKNREYRINNLHKLTEPIHCGCGMTFQKKSKSCHLKSLRHIKYIETLKKGN